MIRLVAFDLDNTALDNEKKLSKGLKSALESLYEMGIMIVPSTGRVFSGVPYEVRQLKGVKYIIATNGGGIYDNETGECIKEYTIDSQSYFLTMDKLKNLPVMADTFYSDGALMDEDKAYLIDKMNEPPMLIKYIKDTRELVASSVDIVKKRGIKVQKITVNFAANKDKSPYMIDEAWKAIEGIPDIYAVPGGTNNIEITAKDVSKATALSWICKRHNISSDEVMAFGDSGNDLDMIEYAKIGVAVDNADSFVKEKADIVTKSNEEGGVAHIINEYFKDAINPNPLTGCDYPDSDVIRVDDTYYMVSTTMHFMPGCVVLRSYNLINWEIVTYVYNELERTDRQLLDNNSNAYGNGMWAATLRYHDGLFYILFVANDTQTTYLFTSKDIDGPWEKNTVEGFYHDASLLFDDGSVYIAYGNTDIYITELAPDLSGPKKGGLNKLVVTDNNDVWLGYEGTHFYKINGKYYLFFIHIMKGHMRSQACYYSDKLEGPYVGGEIFEDDNNYLKSGIAQGGIVCDKDGSYYSIMFQDSEAIGRVPQLIPVFWNGDYPVFGVNNKTPKRIPTVDYKKGYKYQPLFSSDDFSTSDLKKVWQWNHIPDNSKWSIGDGFLRLESASVCNNVTQAKNTLTQRFIFPASKVSVVVDASNLNVGDVAGICMLEADYGVVAITRREDGFYLEQIIRPTPSDNSMNQKSDTTVGRIVCEKKLEYPKVLIETFANFMNAKDEAQFSVKYFDEKNCISEEYEAFGQSFSMNFKLNHFCGCRIGLCCYSTEKISEGYGLFTDFKYFVLPQIDVDTNE